MKAFLEFVPWLAVIILSLGYWFQVWRIHIHREVRDLSLASYVSLTIGFAIMATKAYAEDSLIFLIKQIATAIPCLIIVAQIFIHKDDHWHDENDEHCRKCSSELEPHWDYCPFCSSKRGQKAAAT